MTKQTTIFIIKDSNQRYSGTIGLSAKNLDGTGTEFDYWSELFPTRGDLIKANAELKLAKLKELNSLAGFSVDWQLVELSQEEFEGMAQKGLNLRFENSSIELKDVAKGCVTSHRKMCREIHRKYKLRTLENVA